VTRRAAGEAGSVSALVAVVALGLVMVAGLAYDGGQIIAAQATARDLASNAARAGAQEIDLTELRDTGTALLDPARATAAAEAYLARIGHAGRVTIDGPAITVAVDVHQPMHILPLPTRTITAVHTATALTEPTDDG
jgi:Flp pilus assembly protein TadG